MRVIKVLCCLFFFFKQKTAYEMRISDWSSDVCSSDLEADAFDHVGIERALREKFGAADLLGFVFKDIDEGLADELALGLGVRHAREPVQEQRLGIHMNERDVVMATEQADDLIGLTGAHQPVIDEHTRSEAHTSELQSLMRNSYSDF